MGRQAAGSWFINDLEVKAARALRGAGEPGEGVDVCRVWQPEAHLGTFRLEHKNTRKLPVNLESLPVLLGN